MACLAQEKRGWKPRGRGQGPGAPLEANKTCGSFHESQAGGGGKRESAWLSGRAAFGYKEPSGEILLPLLWRVLLPTAPPPPGRCHKLPFSSGPFRRGSGQPPSGTSGPAWCPGTAAAFPKPLGQVREKLLTRYSLAATAAFSSCRDGTRALELEGQITQHHPRTRGGLWSPNPSPQGSHSLFRAPSRSGGRRLPFRHLVPQNPDQLLSLAGLSARVGERLLCHLLSDPHVHWRCWLGANQ